MSEQDKWIVHEDRALEIKGFRIGDMVQWRGHGQRLKILVLLQLKKDTTRWYAYVEGKGATPQNLGLDFLRKCDVIEQLGSRLDEEG